LLSLRLDAAIVPKSKGGSMRRILPLLLALGASAAVAQDFDVAEEEVDFNNAPIVVTGTRVRSDFEGYSSTVPLVGYQRQADYLLQPIRVTGDTRDAKQRVDEIHQTIQGFLRAANAQGFTLAYGDVVTTDVTSANLRDLPLGNAGRPDTSGITLYASTKLAEMDVASAVAPCRPGQRVQAHGPGFGGARRQPELVDRRTRSLSTADR
jgi:hypothetical protein